MQVLTPDVAQAVEDIQKRLKKLALKIGFGIVSVTVRPCFWPVCARMHPPRRLLDLRPECLLAEGAHVDRHSHGVG